jgi:hypothetical protein
MVIIERVFLSQRRGHTRRRGSMMIITRGGGGEVCETAPAQSRLPGSNLLLGGACARPPRQTAPTI